MMNDIKLDVVHHGDCIDFMANMPDKFVNMSLTDIPYDECNKDSGGLREINKGQADVLTFDLSVFLKEVQRVTLGSIYIFCGIQQVSSIYQTFRNSGLVARHCVWQKSNPSPMNGMFTWLSALENCVFAKFPGGTFNGKCESNVWKFKSGVSKIHPTQKPFELINKLITTSSNKGDVVFDPCIGSGTTAISSIATRRHFIGCEINNRWYSFAKTRIRNEIARDMFCLQNERRMT